MYHPQLGDPVDLLDTPSMIVDIPLMEQNIARLMGYFRKRNVRVRPHLKTVKSPELAHILLAAGATGCCVAKVSEAEIMAQAGVEALLITSEIVGKPKLARLVTLVHGRLQRGGKCSEPCVSRRSAKHCGLLCYSMLRIVYSFTPPGAATRT